MKKSVCVAVRFENTLSSSLAQLFIEMKFEKPRSMCQLELYFEKSELETLDKITRFRFKQMIKSGMPLDGF